MTVALLTRRNVGMIALSYLKAKGYIVKLISDDENVLWLANNLDCEIVTIETVGEYDLLLSVHWNKIIPKKYLKGVCVNIHPCLSLYRGKNPIQKYIDNQDEFASLESHIMVEEADAGEVIHGDLFETGVVTDFANFYNVAFFYYYKTISSTLHKLGI